MISIDIIVPQRIDRHAQLMNFKMKPRCVIFASIMALCYLTAIALSEWIPENTMNKDMRESLDNRKDTAADEVMDEDTEESGD